MDVMVVLWQLTLGDKRFWRHLESGIFQLIIEVTIFVDQLHIKIELSCELFRVLLS